MVEIRSLTKALEKAGHDNVEVTKDGKKYYVLHILKNNVPIPLFHTTDKKELLEYLKVQYGIKAKSVNVSTHKRGRSVVRKHKRSKPKKNWKVIIKSDRQIVWANTHSKTSVMLGMRGKTDNYVWISGRGRRQYQYLCGGNSTIHDATKTKALRLAREWMKAHPKG